jgi:nucleolar protein 12
LPLLNKIWLSVMQFHSESETCNAYIVFACPHPDRPENVAPILDPSEAATKCLAANGSTFMGRTIRVDSAYSSGEKHTWLPNGMDSKCSLFVGGVDYAAKDEELRVFFDELVKAERGPGRWVTGVRLVRDKETQLGKGFGYVHFAVSGLMS